ncbi:MAG: ATP-binding protein [Magnetococcus sp. YQC-3]
MENRQLIAIKKPILLPIAAGLLSLLTVFALSTLWTLLEQEKAILEQTRTSVRNHYQNIVTSETMALITHAEIISRLETLQSPFLQQNRAQLLALSQPIHTLLMANNAITHFYFHDLQRNNFLRVHQPRRHGDHIDRLTLLQAEQQDMVAHGIELGPLGSITLRVVLPWHAEGRLIGYIELGKELNHLVHAMKSRADMEIHVFVPKEILKSSGVVPEKGVADGFLADWNLFTEFAILGKNGATLPVGLQHYILSGALHQETPFASLRELLPHALDKVHFFSIPLHNPARQTVGYLVVANHFGSFHDAAYFHLATILLASTLLSLSFILVFYAHLRRVEKKIRSATKQLQDKEARVSQALLDIEKERDFSKLLLESTGDGIYGLDIHGNCTFLNLAASRMLGFSPPELLGARMHDKIHYAKEEGTPYPYEECSVQKAMQSGAGMRWDNEVFWRKDGSHFPVECSSYPLFAAGKIIGGVVVFRDITASKVLQQQLERLSDREKYLAFQEGVAEMGTTLLHNIGNAIMSISYRTEMLEGKSREVSEIGKILQGIRGHCASRLGKGETMAQVYEELLGALETTGESLLQIGQQVLSQDSRKIRVSVQHITEIIKIHLGSAGGALRTQEFALRQLLEDAVVLQEDLLAKEQVAVRIEMEPPNLSVTLPRSQMLQLLVNLLKNAREAIQHAQRPVGSGQIAIRTRLLPEDRFALMVEDNGCGVDPKDLEHLFEYGFTTKPNSTGFGLHSIATFVQSVTGKVAVESDGPGQGCQFIINLPVVLPQGG